MKTSYIPVITPLPGDADLWVLLNDWELSHTDLEEVIEAGFIFDLASRPWYLASVFQKTDRRTWGPSLNHDYRYRYKKGPRIKADYNFFLDLRKNAMPVGTAALAFLAVRVGGWVAWGKYA